MRRCVVMRWCGVQYIVQSRNLRPRIVYDRQEIRTSNAGDKRSGTHRVSAKGVGTALSYVACIKSPPAVVRVGINQGLNVWCGVMYTEWLAKGEVKQLVLVITGIDTNETLER